MLDDVVLAAAGARSSAEAVVHPALGHSEPASRLLSDGTLHVTGVVCRATAEPVRLLVPARTEGRSVVMVSTTRTVLDSPPPGFPFPRGVRTASMMTASVMSILSLQSGERRQLLGRQQVCTDVASQ
ncbi:MAG TPA: hypothetical protein VNU26_11190, partial [Mycobacteriales bacterium]|nr:hypothetical protein [Mycobacteriales bacterium]